MARKIYLSLLYCMLLIPSTAWALYPPLGVLTPSFSGLICVSEKLCVDDIARLDQAQKLYDEALEFVSTNLGELENAPRAYFCAHESCSTYFGMHHSVAYNVGTSGFAIKPNGWTAHFVRHELIHHLQNERLGSFHNFFFKPDWLLEGMAYSMSEDPRRPIPGDGSLEAYRSQFEKWYSELNEDDIWEAAAKISN